MKMHSILLGGLGGDSHSVGLTILRQALTQNGFRVFYLGIQNRLEEFFEFSSIANAILISNMDGHAKQYLREFPRLIEKYKPFESLWYLGGNLTIGDSVGYERQFIEMGFHRVFVKFIDVVSVIDYLKKDLHSVTIAEDKMQIWEKRFADSIVSVPEGLIEEKISVESFERERKFVLGQYKTGLAAQDLEENARFLVRQPNFASIQQSVNLNKREILIQPRSGVATVQGQIDLFNAFKAAGAGVLSYQVDSFTRNNNYNAVEEILNESPDKGLSELNGFPVINHGVQELRKIISTINVPLQTRHSTRDPRLLCEVSLGGGVTAFEGGAICYNIPYYKNYPLSESIRNWQYVDRLVGFYAERFGVVIDREFFGTLTATLIPPCLAIIVNLLQSILAVQQGVKCLSLGYAEQGNRIQDIAAFETMREVIPEIISNLGYPDIQINTIFHQYMAAFPPIPTLAENLILNSGTTAKLSGVTRILTKTPVEAIKIPNRNDNIHGIHLTMRGLEKAKEINFEYEKVKTEKDLIKREVLAIFDEVFFLGHGSVIKGIIKAFQKGVIDIPFSPSIYNRGEVVTARDNESSIRFLNIGNLPFPRELKDFHSDKMGNRKNLEGIVKPNQEYLLVEKDVLRIARAQFENWPLAS